MKDALNLTSMIDMMTILLIFLLVQYASMSFTDQEATNSQIPQVSDGGLMESPDQLILKKEGLVDKEGKSIPYESLKGKTKLSLQIDKTLKMKDVIIVQHKLNEYGINHIEMAVIETK